MAERKNIVKGKMGNAVTSVAPDHVAAVAEDIFDESRQQYQNEINDEFGKYEENVEFARLYLDSNGRIVEAICKDGTKIFGAGVQVNGDLKIAGNIEQSGYVTTFIDNPEFVKVEIDSNGRIIYGYQKNGNVLFGAGVPSQIVSAIESAINQTKEYIDQKVGENVLAIEFEENGDVVAYYGEEGINDIYVEDNGDIVVEQIIND